MLGQVVQVYNIVIKGRIWTTHCLCFYGADQVLFTIKMNEIKQHAVILRYVIVQSTLGFDIVHCMYPNCGWINNLTLLYMYSSVESKREVPSRRGIRNSKVRKQDNFRRDIVNNVINCSFSLLSYLYWPFLNKLSNNSIDMLLCLSYRKPGIKIRFHIYAPEWNSRHLVCISITGFMKQVVNCRSKSRLLLGLATDFG